MKRRNFFLPDALWSALQERAQAQKSTISEVVRQLLYKALGINEQR